MSLSSRLGLTLGIRLGIACGVDADEHRIGGIDGVDWLDGDSNMYGSADSAGADPGLLLDAAYSASKFDSFLATGTNATMAWELDAYRDLQPHVPSGASNMGPELTLGRFLNVFGGDAGTTRLAKTAVLGIPIGGTQGLLPSATFPTAAGTVTDSFAVVTASPAGNVQTQETARIDAVLSLTGKPLRSYTLIDGNDTASMGSTYAASLSTKIAAVRAKYGAVPVFIVQTTPNLLPALTYPDLATVRAAQAAFCATSSNDATLIKTDDLRLLGDNVHWTANSQAALGNRIGAAIAKRLRPARVDSLGAGPAPWVQSTAQPWDYAFVGAPMAIGNDDVKIGDLQILHVNTQNVNTVPALTTANGFTAITGAAVVSATTIWQHTKLWARPITSADFDAGGNFITVSPVVTDTSDELVAGIITVRGIAALTATNIEVVNTAANNSTGLAVSIPGGTTLGADRLILTFVSAYVGGVGLTFGAWSCTNATGPADIRGGSGSAFIATDKMLVGVMKATKATAGAFGPSTSTISASYSIWGGITLAIAP